MRIVGEGRSGETADEKGRERPPRRRGEESGPEPDPNRTWTRTDRQGTVGTVEMWGEV